MVLTEDGDVWTWGQPWPPGDMYVAVNGLIIKLHVFVSLCFSSVHIIDPCVHIT